MGNQWVSRSFVCNLHRMYENVACAITVDIVVYVQKSVPGCFKLNCLKTVVRVGWFLTYPGWHNQSTPAPVPCGSSTCMHSSQTIVPLPIPMNKIQNNPCLYFFSLVFFITQAHLLSHDLSIFSARSKLFRIFLLQSRWIIWCWNTLEFLAWHKHPQCCIWF